MAQHIPVENIEDAKVQAICNAIRNQKYFKTSLRFFDIPYEEYKETPTDAVYGCTRAVPASVTVGRKAYFEVHTEPEEHGARKVTNIYLVA